MQHVQEFKIAIVYKSCGNYIVELELFPDSKTNLNRVGVIEKKWRQIQM